MKIGMQTWGSNGDIRPFIALAEGLIAAGHQVTLVVSSLDDRSYSDICQRLNIKYQQVPEHMNFDLEDFAQRSFKMNTFQWLMALLNTCYFPFEQQIYQAAQTLAQQNDVLIGHHFVSLVKLAALKQNKPYVSVTLCHVAIPSPSQAPFRLPDLGAFLNRWQWRLMELAFDWFLKKPMNRLWLQEGQREQNKVLTNMLRSDLLNLVAVDPLLSPQHHEWHKVHQACGFLNLSEQAEDWQPSTALQAFLSKGEKPVYMTFGSLQQTMPEWSMQLFINATRLAGCRAIIQTSSDKYPAETQDEKIFFIGRHPHQPVFKQCAAVVHHGGAGTSHAATLSGCPSIVVPFMDEQLFWGKQLQLLGFAPEPLPAKSATAEKLAERLNIVLHSAQMHLNAQHAVRRILPTQGVANAVKLIEQCYELVKDSAQNNFPACAK